MVVKGGSRRSQVDPISEHLPVKLPNHSTDPSQFCDASAFGPCPSCNAAVDGVGSELEELEEGGVVRRVEEGIRSVLGTHPDSDVLVPLALLEVATDEKHRTALEAVVEESQCFRDYVYKMVSAVVPTEAPDEVPVDDYGQRPVTPAHRRRICSQVNSRLDESSEDLCTLRMAYLQLAKHYHPDKGGDQDMFVTLQAAYELLQTEDSQGSHNQV
mmetsp:Transcript_75621/g.175327  ORF Transcript_75621/g.175327 Transcript_75621/m.175327 type:complete len:214 (-) Transcript_75621:113-754(-)|eukprot:CAMPEP_0171060526 /NCGR_PEP_ID=MMETSP0766_2-20121228/3897_1 /TAXON_ID=439317 /ORGANISM="Gambierdiscus australes, Strain CAWD 149" /LENGTH=213 /DNA_ID=CAMNT_0011516121 /DNA_START=128 /DNA_END=769 /DNA_ORIENTATION=+